MRFKVSGLDENGDRHTFETDDEVRARDMFAQFREDLCEVTFDEGGEVARRTQ